MEGEGQKNAEFAGETAGPKGRERLDCKAGGRENRDHGGQPVPHRAGHSPPARADPQEVCGDLRCAPGVFADLGGGVPAPFSSVAASGEEPGLEDATPEDVVTFPPGADKEIWNAYQEGKITLREASKALADLAQGSPVGPTQDALERIQEEEAAERSEDREGVET
jgi:hypothetical protein